MTRMNIANLVLRHGKVRPDAEALVENDRVITYRELAELVRRSAAHLATFGLNTQDRIGLCFKDSIAHVVALLAVTQIGAVAVPLDWRARPAENARVTAAANIKLALVEPDAPPSLNTPIVAVDAAWDAAVARSEPLNGPSGDWNAPFMISATSGSTGAPKLTMMTHVQYYFGTAGIFEVMALAGPQRYLSTLPLCNMLGRTSCLAHLIRGDCVILFPALFDPAEYVEAVRRYAVTVGRLVPAMVRRLLAEHSGTGPLLPELMALICGGAPLYGEEKRQALRRLTQTFHQSYGTTETMIISVLRPLDIARQPDSVGQPNSLGKIEIVDDQDRRLPAGVTGHLRYRGPALATPLPGTEAVFRNGWFYPGEIARMDDLSYIFLEGRASEVIVRSGGIKVQPLEVEQILGLHPDVIEASVFGQRNSANDEEVVAFVVARRHMEPIELLEYCRGRLTATKIPRRFHFLKDLPRSTAGKVDRLVLARLATKGE